MIHIGDVIQIPLQNNKYAYAQYLYKDKKYCDLISVFNYFTSKEENPLIDKIIHSGTLFPPVFTVLSNATKREKWKIIGHSEIKNFKFPNFLNTFYYTTGEAGFWFLYDGKTQIQIGKILPDKYKNLEFLSIYAPSLISKRILTREKHLDDLIRTNKTIISNLPKNNEQ